MVGARGGGIRGFGEGPGYLFGGKGGIVLVARKAEERRRWGLGGKKVVKKRLHNFGWVRGHW